MLRLNSSKKINSLTIVDTGICNLGSLLLALGRIGIAFNVTCCANVVSEARSLVLPGVGAFADGMAALARHGLIEPILSHAETGKPLLGICLGMQLLADGSEEFGNHKGLGIVPGQVKRLPSLPVSRVPNIGWCDVYVDVKAKLFSSSLDNTPFYFTHSYAMECNDPQNSVGTIKLSDREVTVACQRGNVFGVQFHPEKSQDAGLEVLARFSSQ